MEQDNQLKLDEISSWLQNEFGAIRTGQASPALLDSIKAESYGSMLPLNQMSNVGVEDARTLRIRFVCGHRFCWCTGSFPRVDS